jgi:hypothetical protein
MITENIDLLKAAETRPKTRSEACNLKVDSLVNIRQIILELLRGFQATIKNWGPMRCYQA